MLLGVDIAVWSLLILFVMVGLLVVGVPLAFTTGSIAVALCLLLYGPQSLFLLGSRTFSFLDSYALVAVPFFIFMASILERSGLARELYDSIRIWTGRAVGGAATVTTLFAIIIGAIVGVAGGEMVLLGLVALPQLLRLGYDRKLSIGLVCATGALGSMIPPALTLVFFGLTAGADIGDLFTASFVPGLMMAAIFLAYVQLRLRLNPALGPAEEVGPTLTLGEKFRQSYRVLLPLVVLFSTLGSIYLGIASVTESAAVGAFCTVLAVASRGELTIKILRDAIHQTLAACGMVLWLVIGTNALVGVYALMGGIDFAKAMLTGLPIPPFAVLILMVLVWVFLGFFIDWIAILLLTIPIFMPAIKSFGYDPIWVGVLFNMAVQIGYLTPPFAPACFFIKGVCPPEIRMEEIFSAMWPFVGLQIVALVLVMLFPAIALWLPSILN
ncbi:MAG: TRAP transporter large permease subunit [Rhizobiales bacterium]|nr:TRAP transporter large permease subunit [Hyphomicrobiales bacterium]